MSACPFHGSSEQAGFTASLSAGLGIESELSFLNEAHGGTTDALRRIEITRALAAGKAAPLTSSELTWAGRIAWRNHARCIGRLHWRSLIVRDCREIIQPEEIAESLREHLVLAQGNGSVKPILSVYAPANPENGCGPRIWNQQLCAYAGYRQPDGTILGDPASERITRLALELGWVPPDRQSQFDLLPWIISGSDGVPGLFPLPADCVHQVRLRHPRYPWFEGLGLLWYAVPIVSGMRFRAAGTDFTAAPFNGWYMGTEIGARNLADTHRYNLLPRVAELLGLDRNSDRSLWRDHALLVLNEAVLHSYGIDGVKMVDHHSASEEFMLFMEREKRLGREVSARWDWIVPPMSGATTRVFHTPMREFQSSPDFHAQ